MSEINLVKTSKPKVIPQADRLGFGQYFSDHMFTMDYDSDAGWHNPSIIPHEQMGVWPEMISLHYGQEIFEGMKAFKTVTNKIVLFRPSDYLQRFNRSAALLSIPQIDLSLLLEGIKSLIDIDKIWIPDDYGTSLYIRPFVLAADQSLAVKASASYKLFVIVSPVGAYYSAGFHPVSIKVEDKYVRAFPGGIGEAKTAANYAASLRAQVEANKEGFDQVLWLDAGRREYIEEVGTMNIFFKINGELVTPALNGSILAGITRKTVIELAAQWGYTVREREISIQEVFDAYDQGLLEESFGSGTAAVISPVGQLFWQGRRILVNGGKTGLLTQKLFDHIMAVQYGKENDDFGWIIEIASI